MVIKNSIKKTSLSENPTITLYYTKTTRLTNLPYIYLGQEYYFKEENVFQSYILNLTIMNSMLKIVCHLFYYKSMSTNMTNVDKTVNAQNESLQLEYKLIKNKIENQKRFHKQI